MPYIFQESWGHCSTGAVGSTSYQYGAGGKYATTPNHPTVRDLGGGRGAAQYPGGAGPTCIFSTTGGFGPRISGGFYFYPNARNDNVDLFYVQNGANNKFGLRWNYQTGEIFISRGFTLVAGTGALGTTVGTVHHIGFDVVIGDTTGVARIYHNGFLISEQTAVDTQNLGASEVVDRIHIGWNVNDRITTAEISDLFLNTSGFDGKLLKVGWRNATTGGAYAQWTPSASTNYTNVDDGPRGHDLDTTYNYTSTTGQQDGFGILASTGFTEVRAVSPHVWARRDGPDAAGVKVGLRGSTGGEAFGAVQGLSTVYSLEWVRPYNVEPATSTGWTSTSVNAAQVLYEFGGTT